MAENYWGIYIMGDNRPTMYTGVSNNIIRQVLEHKKGVSDGFAKSYNLKKLLYYEFIEDKWNAIIREKQIKNLSRAVKIELIKTKNPYFADISAEIFSLCDDVNDIVLAGSCNDFQSDSGQAGVT